MDRMTPEQRHKCMSHIRGKNTRPELIVRQWLFAHGYRYRLHVRRLPGTPDIVMRRLRTVILVNGCFWHGHLLDDGSHCSLFVTPRSRTDFWQAKIARNQERDLRNRLELTHLGWNVIRIWECQLKPSVRETTLMGLGLTLSQIELSLASKNRKPLDEVQSLPHTNIEPLDEEESLSRMVADDGNVELLGNG